jgi:hypothetical protein
VYLCTRFVLQCMCLYVKRFVLPILGLRVNNVSVFYVYVSVGKCVRVNV